MKTWWVILMIALVGVSLGCILALQSQSGKSKSLSNSPALPDLSKEPLTQKSQGSVETPKSSKALPDLSEESPTQKSQGSVETPKSSSSGAYIEKLAQLNTTQIEQLRSIDNLEFGGRFNFKAVIPTRIPQGFQIENFEVEPVRQNNIGYEISYHNQQNNSCFSIEVDTSAGGDDATGYDAVEVIAPAFGRVILEYTNFDRSGKGGYIAFPHYSVSRSRTSYRFSSPSRNPYNAEYSGCKRMRIQEAVEVVQSFQYLNTRNNLNFPQNTCGDKPTETTSRWYPVFIDGANLEKIRSYLCQDAVGTIREKTGKPAVMLGSFTSKKRAEEFANIVRGQVGEPDGRTSSP